MRKLHIKSPRTNNKIELTLMFNINLNIKVNITIVFAYNNDFFLVLSFFLFVFLIEGVEGFIILHFKILKAFLSVYLIISGTSLLLCKSSQVLQFNSLNGSRPFSVPWNSCPERKYHLDKRSSFCFRLPGIC